MGTVKIKSQCGQINKVSIVYESGKEEEKALLATGEEVTIGSAWESDSNPSYIKIQVKKDHIGKSLEQILAERDDDK